MRNLKSKQYGEHKHNNYSVKELCVNKKEVTEKSQCSNKIRVEG